MRKFAEPLLVCILFLGSIVFRLWFISLVPQPFAWDQDEYQWYATKIFYHPQMLAAHTYRSYPYPLFLAVLYKFVGFANHQALFTVQAIIDAATGVLVYLLLSVVTRRKPVALLGMFLYGINPITSGYVGVGLSEILTSFFITATIATGVWFVKKPGLPRGFLFGFCAGMAAETRNAAFIWAAIPILLTVPFIGWKRNTMGYAAIGLGVLLTMLYPLHVNWREYRQISFTTVDSFYAKELFNGAVLKVLPPFTYTYPVVTNQMFYEYYSEFYPDRTPADRKAMAAKYYKKAWDLIVADPLDYIRWRFFKMWYVWQKENVFFYKEPNFRTTRPFVYFGNVVLLCLALIGMIKGLRSGVSGSVRWIWLSFLGSVLYVTLAFSFTHAEYRITVPFYPLLIMSAAYGMVELGIRKNKN
jgi:hypothetical protein